MVVLCLGAMNVFRTCLSVWWRWVKCDISITENIVTKQTHSKVSTEYHFRTSHVALLVEFGIVPTLCERCHVSMCRWLSWSRYGYYSLRVQLCPRSPWMASAFVSISMQNGETQRDAKVSVLRNNDHASTVSSVVRNRHVTSGET